MTQESWQESKSQIYTDRSNQYSADHTKPILCVKQPKGLDQLEEKTARTTAFLIQRELQT